MNSVYLCLGLADSKPVAVASTIPQPPAAGSPPQIQKRPSYRYNFLGIQCCDSFFTVHWEMRSATHWVPFLNRSIAFTPWVLILPLPFSTGLETFSQLVWKSAEGTVSMDSPRGLWDFLQNLSCLALDSLDGSRLPQWEYWKR